MRLTKAQRAVMGEMATGSVLVPYGDQFKLTDASGVSRLVPRRTLEAMHRNGWTVSLQFPGARPMWFLNDAGRAVLKTSASRPASPGAEGGA